MMGRQKTASLKISTKFGEFGQQGVCWKLNVQEAGESAIRGMNRDKIDMSQPGKTAGREMGGTGTGLRK